MTVKESKNPKNSKEGRASLSQLLFCFTSAAVLALTFFYSETAISSMAVGLRLCVNMVIPSLFPFMVLSELFISSGAAGAVGKIFGKPLSLLFGISPDGASALLLGFICGFPIGTKSAVLLYEQGSISKSELEHLTVFCNNPSSAFLVSAVGIGLFGSRKFGLLLYAAHLLSASIVGIISGIYYRKDNKTAVPEKAPTAQKCGFSGFFVNAVTGSASSMLFICAFVVFFSAVLGYLRLLCDSLALPPLLQVLLLGFFEMTGGVSAASALPSSVAAPIAALLCGWSGLSVHFQFAGICGNREISIRPYLLGKLSCAVLNFALVSLLLVLYGHRLGITEASGSMSYMPVFSPANAVLLALFSAACGMLYKKSKQKF